MEETLFYKLGQPKSLSGLQATALLSGVQYYFLLSMRQQFL